jgi:hypothetical protein
MAKKIVYQDDDGNIRSTTSKEVRKKGSSAYDEGTFKTRRGGGIKDTVAELRSVFGKKK